MGVQTSNIQQSDEDIYCMGFVQTCKMCRPCWKWYFKPCSFGIPSFHSLFFVTDYVKSRRITSTIWYVIVEGFWSIACRWCFSWFVSSMAVTQHHFILVASNAGSGASLLRHAEWCLRLFGGCHGCHGMVWKDSTWIFQPPGTPHTGVTQTKRDQKMRQNASKCHMLEEWQRRHRFVLTCPQPFIDWTWLDRPAA